MFKKMFLPAAAGAVAALMSVAAHAAPVVFFGENQNPGGAFSGTPATARLSFLSTLAGVASEGFERFAVDTAAPLALSFTGSSSSLGATLTGSGRVENDAGGAGRFNTTPGGSKWFEVNSTFAIEFATAISAFGFNGTDIGDFNGRVTIALTDINNAVTTLTVANTINGNNASLLFWGFTDAVNSYKRITFGNTAAGSDVFGFDDMVIGDRGQVVVDPSGVPEPGSLALVGLSLLGLAATRRRAAKR